LPKLVAEKKLREYRDLSSEEKEVADANERLQESIDELKENNPEDLRIEILQKQFKYIHYHKVYELHYDYLRQLRGIVNHNSN
jgi:hypothetical protein